VNKEEFLSALREGIDLEERDVFNQLEESLKDIDSLNLPDEKKGMIRSKLEQMRRETINHAETLNAAIRKVMRGGANEY